MMGFLIFIAVIAYLIFLVNWKDFLGLLGRGGWAAAALYIVLAVGIFTILTNPHIPYSEAPEQHQAH